MQLTRKNICAIMTNVSTEYRCYTKGQKDLAMNVTVSIYEGFFMNQQSTFKKIYEVVKQIPYGQVATYGQVAAIAGNKRWARVVGYALHANPDPDNIPCYRVVNKEGRVSDAFAFGGKNRQVELLEAEGVKFINGCVDMKHYQWERPIY